MTIPRNRFKGDSGLRHTQEWIAACKGEGSCYSSFEMAASLTEVILLGCVALHETKRMRWNPEKLQMVNSPEMNSVIRPPYRAGWTL